jgi:hypothetical protein
MVLGREPLDDLANEPAAAVLQDRDTLRPVPPAAAGELVDLVPRGPSEQLGQRTVGLGQEMHGEHAGATGDKERVVLA